MKKIASLVLLGLVVCLSAVSVNAASAKVQKIRVCYVYDDPLRTPVEPVIGDNKVIYCDSGLSIFIRSDSGNERSKWGGHREVYINGALIVKDKMALQDFVFTDNALVAWTADVQYYEEDNVVEICNSRLVYTNDDVRVNTGIVCEEVSAAIEE